MAGFTAPTNPTTGTIISTTGYGIPVSAAINALATRAYAKLVQTTTGTTILASGTATPIQWDTATSDTVGGWSSGTNGTKYFAQAGWAGRYFCVCKYSYAAAATGFKTVAIRVNGGAVQLGAPGSRNDSTQGILEATWDAFLNVGDYVEVVATQPTGSGQITQIASPQTSALIIRWIGST